MIEPSVANEGFSIKCPNCLNWTDYHISPQDIAITDQQEFSEIVRDLNGNETEYVHPKLLRCGQPPWVCPAPFEAIVCRSEEEARVLGNIPNAWSIKRNFSLYKIEQADVWDGYVGVLFNQRPVPRQRHILLLRLVDRELLSRSLVGISREIGAPVTVYAAGVFKGEGGLRNVWLPVEQYSAGFQYVPPHYNPFCHVIRDYAMKMLVGHFEGATKPDRCKYGAMGTCSGEMPACLNHDWNSCPSFLDARIKACPCYASDVGLLRKAEKEWMQPSYPGYTTSVCWAGLQELAFPIIVHDIFVGALMTGQFMIDPEKLIAVDGAVRKLVPPGDSNERVLVQRIDRIHAVFQGDRPESDEERQAAQFCLRESHLERVIHILKEHAVRLAAGASSSYQNYRLRSESLFKAEIAARIEQYKLSPDFLTKHLPDILYRLSEFWGFKATYLLRYSPDDRTLSLLAYCGRTMRQSLHERAICLGSIDDDLALVHPVSFLFDRENPTLPKAPPVARATIQIVDIFERGTRRGIIEMPDGRFCFAVATPSSMGVLLLLFAARDSAATSTLVSRVPGGLSPICKEAIFETSVELLHTMERLRALKGIIVSSEDRRWDMPRKGIPKEDVGDGDGNGGEY